MPITLLLHRIRQAQTRWYLRRSVGQLLLRADDHLLDDIGLTRHALERLIAAAPSRDAGCASLRAMQAGATSCARAL